MLNSSYPDFPVPMLVLFGMLLGLTMGMINGLLVWKLEIPAIVVTLGTMSIYRGIIFLLSDGAWVNVHEMSETFMHIPRSLHLGVALLSGCRL